MLIVTSKSNVQRFAIYSNKSNKFAIKSKIVGIPQPSGERSSFEFANGDNFTFADGDDFEFSSE